MRALAVNAGSSSLKLSLLDTDDSELWQCEIPAPRAAISEDELALAIAGLPCAPDVVAHRIVHGGERFGAVRIDDPVLAELRALTALAPLHQPKSLAGVEALGRSLPGLPAVACFDTAFHATMPLEAATYALPRSWREREGLRRYGFHGLSHAYAARRARQLARDSRRTVSCHLGAGASLCAVLEGRSVDTTMGFTPLEGLCMATRSGSVDPGLLLWLQEQEGLSPADMAKALEQESGLLGLSGTADMRELLAREDADAALAIGVYLHRLKTGIGAMAAALGGLDALVFTGGVGERSARIRELACAGLSHLGVALDAARNEAAAGDAEVGAHGAPASVLVIHAREELEMARQARALLAA